MNNISNPSNEDVTTSGVHYRGRLEQVRIYLGKLLRMFIYQNDWKVLPMAALVAGMVALVIRDGMFRFLEGTLEGSFALVFVGIWNGCFNSIQVICRERAIIKREHRSGMHISSYIIAHMIYQALLCLAQSILTVYICSIIGVQFPEKGSFTNYIKIDVAVCIFLITYAADMMALWISSIARTTTTAMTVMPFILIFQLVFSGGIFDLPDWSSPVSAVTVSHSGMQCVAAIGRYNELPMVSGWNSLMSMRNETVTFTFTVGQALDYMADSDNESMRKFRDTEVEFGLTAGDMLTAMNESPNMEERRKDPLEVSMTVDEIINNMGREKVKDLIRTKTAESSYKKEYDASDENIISAWLHLGGFILVFAGLSVITLEFIDKDRR